MTRSIAARWALGVLGVLVVATGCGSGAAQDDDSMTARGPATSTTTKPVDPAADVGGAAEEPIGGVVPGEVQWIEPPQAITEPIVPEDPDDPSSVLDAAARTMLRSTWSADLVLADDPDAGGSSPPLGSGAARIDHRPIGRVDFHWDDGTSEIWREAWMITGTRYHNVDPVVGMLHAFTRSSSGARPTLEPGEYVVPPHTCSTRELQDMLVPDQTAVVCGELTAVVSDGRIASAAAELPGRSIGVSLTVTDEPVEPVVRPSADEACITTVGIPGWIERPLAEEYVSVLQRRFELQAASVGFVPMDPSVPTTALSTDLQLPQFVSHSGCVPVVYPPDGWVIERTDDPPPPDGAVGAPRGVPAPGE